MDWFRDFINSFWESLRNFALWVLDLFIDTLSYALPFILDGIFSVVTALVAGLDLGSYALSYASAWGLLPSQLIYLLNACYVPQCLTIMAGAHAIRFILNLIPASFTRI